MNAMIQAVSGVEAVVQNAQTMQALHRTHYGDVGVLHVGEHTVPKPKSGEVIVRVVIAGLDRGAWHLMTGRPYLMRLVFGFRSPKDPSLGREVAGVVTEVGENVTRFRVGDEVFGIGEGSFAEFVCAREDKLVLKPREVSFEQAGVSGISALTAIQALDKVNPQRGERVLLVGASGGVGTYAVQLAKIRGAHVTAVCSTSKVELVRSLGADAVMDYTQVDFTACGETFDVVLDMGGNTPLSRLRKVMTPRGRLVFVGGEHGGDWSAGFGRQLFAMLLSPFTKQRFVSFMATETHQDLERISALFRTGELKSVIDRSVGLTQVADAMRALEAGNVCGKIAVVAKESI